MSGFAKWDRDAYRRRVGEEEAARRRGAIMAEQWGYQLAEQRNRLGFTQAGLAVIMARTRYLLLDFDGPVCSLFAGLTAPAVAGRLRKLFPAGRLPAEILSSPDPFAVFAYSATVSPELAKRVEAELTDLEVAATVTAEPAPHVHEVIAACRETGRTIALVSNNSARAVTAYLERHGLSGGIAQVAARTSPDPALLKPSPHLIGKAIGALNADPAASAFVGDALTDIEAACRAGIASIGYASEPGSHERMTRAGAGAVITSMAELTPDCLGGGAPDCPAWILHER